jgi:hypothetical protein
MRNLATLAAVSAAIIALATSPAEAPTKAAPAKDYGTVQLAGATWLGSFDEAVRQARESGRPILHLQMFGRLDDAYC